MSLNPQSSGSHPHPSKPRSNASRVLWLIAQVNLRFYAGAEMCKKENDHWICKKCHADTGKEYSELNDLIMGHFLGVKTPGDFQGEYFEGDNGSKCPYRSRSPKDEKFLKIETSGIFGRIDDEDANIGEAHKTAARWAWCEAEKSRDIRSHRLMFNEAWRWTKVKPVRNKMLGIYFWPALDFADFTDLRLEELKGRKLWNESDTIPPLERFTAVEISHLGHQGDGDLYKTEDIDKKGKDILLKWAQTRSGKCGWCGSFKASADHLLWHYGWSNKSGSSGTFQPRFQQACRGWEKKWNSEMVEFGEKGRTDHFIYCKRCCYVCKIPDGLTGPDADHRLHKCKGRPPPCLDCHSHCGKPRGGVDYVIGDDHENKGKRFTWPDCKPERGLATSSKHSSLGSSSRPHPGLDEGDLHEGEHHSSESKKPRREEHEHTGTNPHHSESLASQSKPHGKGPI